MRDDYVWDCTGEPDPFVDEVESMLRHFDRHPSVTPKAGARRSRKIVPRARTRPALWIAAAAAAALLLALMVTRHLTRTQTAVEPPAIPVASMRDASPSRPQPMVRSTAAQVAEVVEVVEVVETRSEASSTSATSSKHTRSGSRRDAPVPSTDAGPTDEDVREASRRILAAIQAKWPSIEACVAVGREQHPERKGIFWLSFSVMPDGSVTNVATIPRGNTRAPDVTGCVVAEVATWSFAPDGNNPSGGNPVRIPIYLHDSNAR